MTIVVESQSACDAIKKVTPIITENLAYRGIELEELNVQIADNQISNQNGKSGSRHHSRANTSRKNDVEAVPVEENLNSVKNYGYNTIELIA